MRTHESWSHECNGLIWAACPEGLRKPECGKVVCSFPQDPDVKRQQSESSLHEAHEHTCLIPQPLAPVVGALLL